MQRMKHHPYFANLLSGASSRIAYGARSLNEGGLQSVPRLDFPGGALIGCSAGFVNIAKIKGTHNAMKTGMLAAEAAAHVLTAADASEASDMSSYDTAVRNSWVWSDLNEVRNLRASFNTPLGIWGGMAYSGLDSLFFKGRTPWTFRNTSQRSDAAHTLTASHFRPIEYPPPQPPLSTDLLTSLTLTGTNHAEDQPVHLRVRKDGVEDVSLRKEHVRRNVGEYAGLLQRACPAGVYEYIEDEAAEDEGWDGTKLVINSQVSGFGGAFWRAVTTGSQNCIHCKLCDIKVPTQDITWTVPEGGGGPKYSELLGVASWSLG
jgi:electron-transferring-flavoprotein dehydrogenase